MVALPGVSVAIVGADGADKAVVVVVDRAEAVLTPTTLVAVIDSQYCTPAVRPVTVQVSVAAVAQVAAGAVPASVVNADTV
jgi:hypothetical protein